MTLKSRVDKLPPPNYYASILAHLVRAYPGAKISVQSMESLKPAWDLLWQSGKSADVAAKTTCSCDGKQITLSPAFDVSVVRGAYRAPAGAARGALFEPAEMRESAPVERARAAQARAEGQAGRILSQAQKLEARLQSVTSPQGRDQLLRTLEMQKAQLREKRALASQIGADLEQLRIKFQSAQAAERATNLERHEGAPKKKQPAQAAAPEQKPPPPKTKVAPPAKPKQDRPRSVPPEKRPAPAPTEAADQAILTAIKGLLPEMAKTLASSLKGA